MKKLCIFALALVLCTGLSACGRRNNANNPETMMPSTNMNILPDTMPTGGTNIPDPDVDTQMPIYTQGTDMPEMDTRGTN